MSYDPVATCLPGIGEQVLSVELPSVGGHMGALRERHLSSAVRRELGQHLNIPIVSTVIPVAGWPLLGRSATDFVAISPPASRSFAHVGELKWCSPGTDKLYEVIWDLFKMALMSRRADVLTAHLITGAPACMWPNALCGDVFSGGTYSPDELCRRRFSRGSRRTAWDDLLAGGSDRHPDRVPGQMTTVPTGEPVELRGPGGVWELRAVRVAIDESSADVPFTGGWPNDARPPDARRPLR
jgi:hypothetical protein